jgi:hypothetical protein
VADFVVNFTPASNFKVKFSQPTQDLTLKNTTLTPTKITNLTDVSLPIEEKVEGAILIYSPGNETFVLRQAFKYDAATQTYRLEGGSF